MSMPKPELKQLIEDIQQLTKAAAEDNADAQFQLGECYKDGKGVEQDIKTACQWYRRAAKLGNYKAKFNLAQIYEKGDGLPKDQGKALYFYDSAAKSGDNRAVYALGAYYENGLVAPNMLKAYSLYRNAKIMGYKNADEALIRVEKKVESGASEKEKAIITAIKAEPAKQTMLLADTYVSAFLAATRCVAAPHYEGGKIELYPWGGQSPSWDSQSSAASAFRKP